MYLKLVFWRVTGPIIPYLNGAMVGLFSLDFLDHFRVFGNEGQFHRRWGVSLEWGVVVESERLKLELTEQAEMTTIIKCLSR